MNFTHLFINRPVATTLLTIGVALTGIAAYFALPVSSLPSVDFPTIQVNANLPGASPQVMATSVATPLERRLGQIADVTEMTSNSSTGQTGITLQFGLDRNIDGAARDVQAAINAARADLPSTLRSNPNYRKINPADQPILILTLQSPTLTNAQIYDAASTVLQQRLSQVEGVGDVSLGGGASPAVRVDYDPHALARAGLSPEDLRNAIFSANANQPKGFIDDGPRRLQIYTNDQARTADDYRNLVVAVRNGAIIRLSDVAKVFDSQEDMRQLGLANGKPAIVVRITRQPGANMIATVDRIRALLPQLRNQMPPQVDLEVAVDRTTTTRGSLFEVERTLLIATVLVVLVVLVFLRNGRATLIPGVAVTVSLLGAVAFMFLFKFSLDNLSLMALTVATGFVVDDAIVVLENITRHVEEGTPRYEAALKGAAEVGFTVFAISISLVAVFIPLLAMGGIIGRLFREFAVTLSASILVSMVVSLTATPMMSARLIDAKPSGGASSGKPSVFARISQWLDGFFAWVTATYEKSLGWALAHRRFVVGILVAAIALNVYLYIIIPKGFMPQQDTGQLVGGLQVDQASSFTLTAGKMTRLQEIVSKDPDVSHVVGFTFGPGGFTFGALKSKPERSAPGVTTDDVISRLRPQLARVAGAQLFLQTVQDFRVGGRQSAAQYQYTLQSDDLNALRTWSERLKTYLMHSAVVTDVNSDQQEHGLETYINVDRDQASRLGVTMQQVDNILYDNFGQRQVSTIYNPLNQYHVVMEADPPFDQFTDSLNNTYIPPAVATAATAASPAVSARLSNPALGDRPPNVAAHPAPNPAATEFSRAAAPTPFFTRPPSSLISTGGGSAAGGVVASSGSSAGLTSASTALAGAGVARTSTGGGASGQQQTGQAVSTGASRMTPLPAFATYALNPTPLSISHQGQSVAATLSFNLQPGKSLSDARAEVAAAMQAIGMPANVHGGFAGTAQAFEASLANEPLLILAALVAVYLVLGVLYESYVHPITVISTLPSAGVGALLALMLFHIEFSIIALIGVILLIGIVKKNAIMIIDFALQAEREGMSPEDAIYRASMLRFRPILMTTTAAILGALPLAVGFGEGGELRRPLGVAIIGGLLASQVLTLITTPVVYLGMDRLRHRGRRRRKAGAGPVAPAPQGG
ncbi:MAG: efflux RND transporter permease subunit [Pseudomonadota bacterium]